LWESEGINLRETIYEAGQFVLLPHNMVIEQVLEDTVMLSLTCKMTLSFSLETQLHAFELFLLF
jgi:hypothetical protein